MLFHRLISAVFRLVLVAVGLLFALFVLAFGVLLSIVLIVWSLLRGKRPRVVRFRVDPRSPFSGMQRTKAAQGEVVDIEVREVPEVTPQLPPNETSRH